jgi:hypothetical protein
VFIAAQPGSWWHSCRLAAHAGPAAGERAIMSYGNMVQCSINSLIEPFINEAVTWPL